MPKERSDRIIDIWQEIKEGEKTKSFPEVLNEILSVNHTHELREMSINNILALASSIKKDDLKDIYLALVMREDATLEGIREEIRQPSDILERNILELVKGGYIVKEKRDDEYYYSINVWRNAYFGMREKIASGPRIPLVYHYSMLCDPRVPHFKNAISQLVKQEYIAADLGAGTGILSLFASEKAKRVYAIEIDPYLVDYARKIIEREGRANKIKVMQGNALSINLPEKVDIIICEMLDTALICELQVPVMNRAIKDLLKPNGKVIPKKALTYIELANVDYSFLGYTFPLIHFENTEVRKYKEILSERVLYHIADFSKENPIQVEKKIKVITNKDGVLNSIRITTDIEMMEEMTVSGSDWFNAPLILPCEDTNIKKGECFNVIIKYTLGGGIESIEYDVERLYVSRG